MHISIPFVSFFALTATAAVEVRRVIYRVKDNRAVSAMTLREPADGQVLNGKGWTHQGCYEDRPDRVIRWWGPRILPGDVVRTFKDSVFDCISECARDPRGYTFAGMEFGNECFCGSHFQPFAGPMPAAECSMQCRNEIQAPFYPPFKAFCGNAWRINVWKLAGSPAPTDSFFIDYPAVV